MGEYGSTGAGAKGQRVEWAKIITDPKKYTAAQVLTGNDKWDAVTVAEQKREK